MPKALLLALAVAFPVLLHAAESRVEEHYVQTTGEGEVKAPPDRVILTFGVQSQAPAVGTVQEDIAKKSQVVLRALERLKVRSADIQTTFVQIHPRYDYVNGRQRFAGYQGEKRFTVTLRQVSDYGRILNAAIEAGVESVGGIQYDSSRLEGLKREARKAAVLNAREKAEDLARALGRSIGRAIRIEDQGAGSGSPPMPFRTMSMESARGGQEDALAPGEITVRANVLVRFELAP